MGDVGLTNDANNDNINYESLKQLLKNATDNSYTNSDTDCKKLFKLACFLFLYKNEANKYTGTENATNIFFNKFWLKQKRKKAPSIKENFYTIACKRKCDNPSCVEELSKQYCKIE